MSVYVPYRDLLALLEPATFYPRRQLPDFVASCSLATLMGSRSYEAFVREHLKRYFYGNNAERAGNLSHARLRMVEKVRRYSKPTESEDASGVLFATFDGVIEFVESFKQKIYPQAL